MNKREAVRQHEQAQRLITLGFTESEANSLRRISNTLRHWYELECGTGDGQVTRSIERDPETDKPFLRVQYPTLNGYVDQRWPTPDREKGAIARLDAVMARRNGHPSPGGGVNLRGANSSGPISYYLQTDPRGAALYIVRPGDVPEGQDVSAYYTRGICVY